MISLYGKLGENGFAGKLAKSWNGGRIIPADGYIPSLAYWTATNKK
tara:strand:+ start:399 stop:536 length:138 start_codon:yes stop_codon:yes gene_type:complete